MLNSNPNLSSEYESLRSPSSIALLDFRVLGETKNFSGIDDCSICYFSCQPDKQTS